MIELNLQEIKVISGGKFLSKNLAVRGSLGAIIGAISGKKFVDSSYDESIAAVDNLDSICSNDMNETCDTCFKLYEQSFFDKNSALGKTVISLSTIAGGLAEIYNTLLANK